MVGNIWRSAHFLLAAVSAIFLLLATVTGIVLAFEPIQEHLHRPSKVVLDEVKLATLITTLKEEYEELLELNVERGKYVKISTFSMDEEGSGDFYIDPADGTRLEMTYEQPHLFKVVTNFHRSLFLKTTGRIFVGITAFLLALIAVTGLLLIIKKLGWRKFFLSFEKNDGLQYYHTYLGRINLIPVVIIAVSGLYLSFVRFEIIDTATIVANETKEARDDFQAVPIADFELFQNTTLDQVKKLEFPFSEDAEDYFALYLEDRELWIHQYTGEVMESNIYPFARVVEKLSFNLHTGATSPLWAVVLLVSSISILYFMYSGFLISYRRLAHKSKNAISAEEAELVVLVGSENGKTRQFSKLVFDALARQQQKVFIDEMNNYRSFPKMKELIVMTSTYGEGEAPVSANQFLQLVDEVDVPSAVPFSVVGFGSTHYEKFCQFAKDVHLKLSEHPAYQQRLEPALVDRNDHYTFTQWANNWSSQNSISIDLPDQWSLPKAPLADFSIVNTQYVDDGFAETVHLELYTKKRKAYQAGDLIAIQPHPNEEERYYSIGKLQNGNLFLAVKRHQHGKVSNMLYQKEVSNSFQGTHISNTRFHFPTHAPKVIMIANGTGIGPFVGMLQEPNAIPKSLFWGLRNAASYQPLAGEIQTALATGRLQSFATAYSRTDGPYHYVQDIIHDQSAPLANDLKSGAIVMICGSLAMLKGVLAVLDAAVQQYNEQPISHYQEGGQILSDCY
ncbi:MAG: PepSY domain-containing protein [Bacteroidota bacterium]